MAYSTGIIFLLLVGLGTTTVAQTLSTTDAPDAVEVTESTAPAVDAVAEVSTTDAPDAVEVTESTAPAVDAVAEVSDADAKAPGADAKVSEEEAAATEGGDAKGDENAPPAQSAEDNTSAGSPDDHWDFDAVATHDDEWTDVYCVSDSRARVDAWTTQPTTTSTTRTTTTRTTTTRTNSSYNYNGYADSAAAEAAGWGHSSSDESVLGRYLNTSKIRCMTESEKGTKNCRRSLTFAKDGRQQATSNEAGCSGTKVCSKEKMNTCTEKLVQRRGIAQYQIECCCNTTLCNEYSPVSKCALDAAGVPAGGASLAAGCASADGIRYKQFTNYGVAQPTMLLCEPVTTSTSTSTSTRTTSTRTTTTTTTRTSYPHEGYGHGDEGYGHVSATAEGATGEGGGMSHRCNGNQAVCGLQTFEGVVRSHCVARQFCYGRMKTCFEMRYPAGTLGSKDSFSTTCCCGGNATCPVFTLPESKCEGKQPGARPAECEAYLSPVHLLDFFDGVEAVETTVNTEMAITLTVPLDIDLTSLTAAELADVKNKLLAAAAKAGGFDVGDVERIELVQDGKVVGSARRGRAANSPITARVIFKDSAVVDFDAVVASVNSAIEAGTVSVSVVVGGETVTAAVSELAAVADKNSIIVDTGGGASGATRVATATMATAMMLLTAMA